MKTIICLPALDWEWMFQRPQQMMRQFAAHGWKVVYCNRTEGDRYLEEVERNFYVCSQLLRLIAEEARFDVVWAPWPDVAHLRGRFKEKLFVYDRMDRFPWWSAEEERMWEWRKKQLCIYGISSAYGCRGKPQRVCSSGEKGSR